MGPAPMIAIRGGMGLHVRFTRSLLEKGVKGIDYGTSTTALITPVSGLVYDGKTSINPPNGVRCVIHGRVSIRPSSISPMIRLKSPGIALRDDRIVISRRWNSGSGKTDGVGDNADKHDPPRERDKLERPAHRLRIAGRVEDDRVKRAVGLLAHLLERRLRRGHRDRVGDAHRVLAEVEPLLIHIEDGNRRPSQLDELDDRQADRPGPDDQHVFRGLRRSAIDRMAADAERLNQCQLIQRELL